MENKRSKIEANWNIEATQENPSEPQQKLPSIFSEDFLQPSSMIYVKNMYGNISAEQTIIGNKKKKVASAGTQTNGAKTAKGQKKVLSLK